MIKIANHTHNEPFDVYGGRGETPPEQTPIGQYGWLGNPYHIDKDGDRDEVIAKFQDYFWRRLGEPEFVEAVKALDGLTVCCWCAPEPCHLNVINDWFKAGCPVP